MSVQPVVRTYLELTDAGAISAPATPIRVASTIERIEPPDGALNRWLYDEVGRDYAWVDLRDRSDAEWAAWARRVETWTLRIDGCVAAYYELDRQGDSVEIAHLGVRSAHQGVGLGGHLLVHALRRALELAPRVWVHTCSTDAPAALPNYLARGLVPFRVETV